MEPDGCAKVKILTRTYGFAMGFCTIGFFRILQWGFIYGVFIRISQWGFGCLFSIYVNSGVKNLSRIQPTSTVLWIPQQPMPIKNRTKGGDSLRCGLSCTNGIKKLNWFCIARYE